MKPLTVCGLGVLYCVAASGAQAGLRIISNGSAEISGPNICIQAAAYSSKSTKQLKEILLRKAREAAIKEIYGAVVKTGQTAKSSSLVKAGILRPTTDPRYYNGKNFGEACVYASYKVTAADMAKMKPTRMNIGGRCHADANVPVKKLKQVAIKEIVANELRSLNPKLKNVPSEQLIGFAGNVDVKNERIDIGTGAYCAEYSFSVVKLELENLEVADFELASKSEAAKKTARSKNKWVPEMPKGTLLILAKKHVAKRAGLVKDGTIELYQLSGLRACWTETQDKSDELKKLLKREGVFGARYRDKEDIIDVFFRGSCSFIVMTRIDAEYILKRLLVRDKNKELIRGFVKHDAF